MFLITSRNLICIVSYMFTFLSGWHSSDVKSECVPPPARFNSFLLPSVVLRDCHPTASNSYFFTALYLHCCPLLPASLRPLLPILLSLGLSFELSLLSLSFHISLHLIPLCLPLIFLFRPPSLRLPPLPPLPLCLCKQERGGC